MRKWPADSSLHPLEVPEADMVGHWQRTANIGSTAQRDRSSSERELFLPLNPTNILILVLLLVLLLLLLLLLLL